MKILLAARDLSGIGGTQTWMATVAKELTEQGHDVVACCASQCLEPWRERFDLGIFSHGTETSAAFSWCDHVLVVSHGIIELERPVPGADAYAFVSEECQDHWGGPGVWQPSEVIRQPIDCEFWAPDEVVRPENPHPYILRYSYYGGLPWLPDVCRQLGYDFHHVKDATPEAAREWIRGASVVISSGRGALEAMACGRPTVICDDRPYNGGPRMCENVYLGGNGTNYSGRGGGDATPERLRSMISEYADGWAVKTKCLDYVAFHHAAPMIVDQLLELAAGR